MTTPDPAFWQRQRVFITGHTGFKGGWLAVWLRMLGAEACGYALAPDTTPSLFDAAGIADLLPGEIADIGDLPRLAAAIAEFRPTIVIHMAAQPLVRRSYAEPRETFATNLLGTVNVLEAVRLTPGIGAAFVVTTDKCYENQEHGRPYRETDRLGGRDPYSASKACAELATQSYFWSFFMHAGCGLASGRAGNVIGGGDWSADRLVPDLIRAFQAGEPAVLRNPAATRPWQHVLEPLNGYLLAVERIFGRPGTAPAAWNFGPDIAGNQSVGDVAAAAAATWGNGAEIVVRRNANEPHEATLLSVDSAKARAELGWEPRW
ncbi:MAG: CDP-glucose 4,6-dehydratase, partial [Rhodopila sp.]|nr:CDP-glucose 4,6-dehydratase [Rhodopila sp.]